MLWETLHLMYNYVTTALKTFSHLLESILGQLEYSPSTPTCLNISTTLSLATFNIKVYSTTRLSSPTQNPTRPFRPTKHTTSLVAPFTPLTPMPRLHSWMFTWTRQPWLKPLASHNKPWHVSRKMEPRVPQAPRRVLPYRVPRQTPLPRQ